MSTIYTLLGDINGFLNALLSSLAEDGIDVSTYELDHLCFRVTTQDEYKQYKESLHKLGTLLSETLISNRPIATFKLNTPIVFSDRTISVIELPAPKPDGGYPKGLEHAEFVIDKPFDEFMEAHPAVSFSTRDIKKPINPDIRVQYSSFSVKFHHKPLEIVIRDEQ